MRDHQKKLIIYVIILAVATVMWPRLSVFADEDFTSKWRGKLCVPICEWIHMDRYGQRTLQV